MDRASSFGSDYFALDPETKTRREQEIRKMSIDGRTTPDIVRRESLSRDRPKDIEMGRTDSKLGSVTTIPASKQITIGFTNVCAYVPAMFGKPGVVQQFKRLIHPDDSKKPKMNQILFDVNGSVNPGEVLALMGPSGSGKTTLLSIVGARAQRSMRIKGEVTFNGEPLTKKVKRKVGYVMQDDLLYESLTVYETLYFAAMLRLPRTMTKAEKCQRVDTVISALGLDHCRDTIIGGFFRRGISGGERKRASVGHELLIDPSVLLLDEPTSGLDSTTAMSLLSVLRQLAHGNRSIICTIHQPSSRLYQQLDKLLLLSKGRTLYYGHAQHAVDYFDRIGYHIPPRVNAADFLLDLASGEVSGPGGDGETSRKYLIDRTAKYLASHSHVDGFDLDREDGNYFFDDSPYASRRHTNEATDGVNGGIGAIGVGTLVNDAAMAINSNGATPISSSNTLADEQKRTINPSTKSFRSKSSRRFNLPFSESMKTINVRDEPGDDDGNRWGAPFMEQVRILFIRSLRTRRFQSLSTQDIVQYLIIAVLAGCFWFQVGQDDTIVSARNIMGLLFFELMFLSFRALFVSLFTFPDEQKHMLKERASGMYRLSAFYIARTASDLPMDLSIPTLFILILYFFAGLRYNAAAFFANYGTVLLSMLVAQSLGLLLGSIVMNPKTAQAIASVLMLTIVLTGGFFVVSIPSWIGWLKYLSYIYYALGLLMYIEFEGGSRVMYTCSAVGEANTCVPTNPANPESDPSCSRITNVKESLGISQDPTSSTDAIRDGMVLLAFLIVLRISVYIVLRRKTAGF